MDSVLEDLGKDRIGVMKIKSENKETVYVIQTYLPSASKSMETFKLNIQTLKNVLLQLY
jgi:hypothetical protein